MTIAACYRSAEGVVFGADSSSEVLVPDPNQGDGSVHHYNYSQKVFQIGDESTLGLTTWGFGSLGSLSYRTLVAQFADNLVSTGAKSVEEVAEHWNSFFWGQYSGALDWQFQRVHHLSGLSNPTDDETNELKEIIDICSVGFCLGGHLLHDRTPSAYVVEFNPGMSAPGPIEGIDIGRPAFWGCPNIIDRLTRGWDEAFILRILSSGKWSGTPDELLDIANKSVLGRPDDLPIREAIDWLHASIYTTIKTMKFSHFATACGGPIELAVITTDRRFRWVRHKSFDAAICEGGSH